MTWKMCLKMIGSRQRSGWLLSSFTEETNSCVAQGV